MCYDINQGQYEDDCKRKIIGDFLNKLKYQNLQKSKIANNVRKRVSPGSASGFFGPP
jgi:hypothetical protein